MNHKFTRYLSAKKPIDDRSLNQYVWNGLVGAVSPASPSAPLKILEMGCGIGTMLERLHEWELYPAKSGTIAYTGIDSDPENINLARKLVAAPSSFLCADLFHLPPTLPKNAFDLLITHAFLDLVDIPRALPVLFSYLRPGGVFYFTLNFDGETIFQPEHPLDPLILTFYHRTMDERITPSSRSGDSRTGRHLFMNLKRAGAEILAAGSSDWVVFPGSDGYPGDEKYFLSHILHFFETSLTGHPELSAGQLSDWIATRRRQMDAHELVYMAHQIDFVGRVI